MGRWPNQLSTEPARFGHLAHLVLCYTRLCLLSYLPHCGSNTLARAQEILRGPSVPLGERVHIMSRLASLRALVEDLKKANGQRQRSTAAEETKAWECKAVRVSLLLAGVNFKEQIISDRAAIIGKKRLLMLLAYREFVFRPVGSNQSQDCCRKI
eukprot:180298-Amphidinium_carterae.1